MAIYPHITRAEYEALPGINWSALKNGIGKTAAHIKAAKAGCKDTPALRFGRLFHLGILQPDLFDALTRVDTKTTKRSDAITNEEEAAISDMAASIDDLGEIIITHKETAITWEAFGVACKGMIDGIHGRCVIDAKSTNNAEPWAFKGEVFKYKYHGQMAYYMDGLIANGFDIAGAELLVCEKAPPYASGLYTLATDWIELGRSCYDEALGVLAANRPASYGAQTLDVPEWAQPGLTMNDEGGIDL